IVGIMVNALCKEGKLQAFVDMIDRIDGKRCLPRLIVNTCFVFVMVEEGRVKDRLVLLKRMMVKNMISDSVSYSLFGSGHRLWWCDGDGRDYEVVMVVMGECGEGSEVHWWRRVKKVVVKRRRYSGVMVVEEIEWAIENFTLVAKYPSGQIFA
ncbi:pentatricopeptide repeat-containing protein, partial [Tanacetum coccineum]